VDDDTSHLKAKNDNVEIAAIAGQSVEIVYPTGFGECSKVSYFEDVPGEDNLD
jgi:hypothetical protein